MRNVLHFRTLSAFALMGAGLLLGGCKSAPDLTQDQAQALIQAKYDQTPPVGISITLNKLGMNMGITDGYWKLTKVYPNKFWADYTLTDDGKKAIKVSTGDVIQWRPQSAEDEGYSLIVETAVANHLRARDVKSVQDEMLPGATTAKGADYTEGVDMTGVPGPLQDIAHNPGNQLSRKRHADFLLDNGAWTLHSTE